MYPGNSPGYRNTPSSGDSAGLSELSLSHQASPENHQQNATEGNDSNIDPQQSMTEERLRELQDENEDLRATLSQRDGELSRLRDLAQTLQQTNSKLHRMLMKNGTETDGLSDDWVRAQFEALKDAIYQLVHKYFLKPAPGTKFHPSSSSDILELQRRSFLASSLYRQFFVPEQLMFHLPLGLDEAAVDLAKLISKTKGHRLKYEDAVDWQTQTVKIGIALDLKGSEYLLLDARQAIWDKMAGFQDGTKKAAAQDDLSSVCRMAYQLTLKLRSTKTEIVWDQEPPTLPEQGDEMHIIGSDGSGTEEGAYVVDMVVFGGVRRGERASGRLKDGATRILKPSVVIK